MADDQFHQATGNWWDSSSSRTAPSQQSSSSNLTSFPNFPWNTDHHHDLRPTSSMSDSPTSTHPNLHMIMAWNNNNHPSHHHSLLREEKGVSDGRFRPMFQENNLSSGGTNFHHQHQQVEWREKLLFSTESSSTSGDSIVTTSQGLANSSFHMDSNNSYSAANPSILLQGLLAPEASSASSSFDNNNHHNRSCFNSFPYASALSSSSDQLMASQFLRASPPKQTPNHAGGGNRQLQFTNNTTFWNASEAHHHQLATIKEARPSCFFPNSLQPPFHSPNFDAQSKNICGGRETSSVGKKSGGETAPKRSRNETSSTLPPFKVRKEKMGDRITALQQLVSPFGKTDTASVLSEAIEYIKLLHEQVSVLSSPYIKSGAPLQHQQSSGKCKENEALKQDLRSRGLCLVPVSSTFPVTHETTVDFWMPTFGATFR
ncbi:hypothetical protein QN277_008654 [Acacia crassicarpa]|uniref:BHLH domain-containing protein n=1 Tax=Acacia crassicarpa TaxID=499986 RepID=A0AAE1M7J5_9FABA|nr:hypothetical protein QN277_008654 [Acacia crassicarpa]